MVVLLARFCGWALARSPESLARATTRALARFLYLILGWRRRLLLSNLHHAYPDLCRRELRRLAVTCMERSVETGLFAAAMPGFSPARLQAMVTLDEETRGQLRAGAASGEPHLILIPHLGCWEALTALPLLYGGSLPRIGVVYRPLDHAGLEREMIRVRSRFGIELLSRKEGFARAGALLAEGGGVGILFDQSAGRQGTLIPFLGRMASATTLPGLLAQKYRAHIWLMYFHRTGFWRGKLRMIPNVLPPEKEAVLIGANRWLETILRTDRDQAASWLWLHDRWRTRPDPQSRFNLGGRRGAVGLESCGRGNRFWIRLPNWLGDAILVAPLLRLLRASRPDAALTLIGPAAFADWFRATDLADDYLPLPPRGPGRLLWFRRLRHRYPDTFLILTQSFRGDLEARLTACPERIGLRLPGRPRPLLTRRWKPVPDFDWDRTHQLRLQEAFWRAFGLQGDLDLSPLRIHAPRQRHEIAVFCGSNNRPDKRWPAGHWAALLASLAPSLPGTRFVLLGSEADQSLAQTVAAAAAANLPLANECGHHPLGRLWQELDRFAGVLAIDSGGMHLANAAGIPTVALFGPTNPLRTGPIFHAPRLVLQPPGCPETGGSRLEVLNPSEAADRIKLFLAGSHGTTAPGPSDSGNTSP
ncbi:MAG: hypothetical protein EA425_06230 [Puniceicoccaceae bacterium]|nr:MAG: hypothetical protein EA425_06230 [Puniceicoccaceae bacterium]